MSIMAVACHLFGLGLARNVEELNLHPKSCLTQGIKSCELTPSKNCKKTTMSDKNLEKY